MNRINTTIDNLGYIEKPPLGLKPKKFYEDKVKTDRLLDVSEAIVRYFNAGLKINIEWIEEYNELIDYMQSKNNQL